MWGGSIEDEEDGTRDIMTTGVSSLIGEQVSLDGESILLPEDDMSSMRDSYTQANRIHMVGTANVNHMPEENPKRTMEAPLGPPIRKKRWLPIWIDEAPRYVKCVIAGSTALLVSAIVLVFVALIAELNASEAGPVRSQNSPPINVGWRIPSPSPTPGPTPKPTPSLDDEPSTPGTTKEPVSAPTTMPVELIPSLSPTMGPTTEQPTGPPFDSSVTSFYVLAGRFQFGELEDLPHRLKTLPVRGGTAFMAHLGDWNSPYATGCDRASYEDISELYSASSVPLYFTPGDNDFNDCDDPDEALTFWRETLVDYEMEYWDPPMYWTVERNETYPENFAFVHNEVLFVSVNLVGGTFHDAQEWATRQQANVAWINKNYELYKDEIQVLVVFTHADIGGQVNAPFYDAFKTNVRDYYGGIQTVLFQKTLSVEDWSWEEHYEGIENLSVISVQGAVWPPLVAVIDLRQEQPFFFDQSMWYDAYVSERNITVP